MAVDPKLKHKHNYHRFADSCWNCSHFNSTKDDGLYNDRCHVDANPLDPDGSINTDQDIYTLPNPWGICDDHNRGR